MNQSLFLDGLKIMNNEPVAWIDKNTGKPRMEGFIHTDYDIPLYTHPAKTLTDAEIMESCHAYHYTCNPDYLGFAREILRKVQEADKIESLGTVNIGGVHYRNGKPEK